MTKTLEKEANSECEDFGTIGNIITKVSFFGIAPIIIMGYEFYNRLRDYTRHNGTDPQEDTPLKGKIQHLFNSTRAYQICRTFKISKNTCNLVCDKYRKVIPPLLYHKNDGKDKPSLNLYKKSSQNS